MKMRHAPMIALVFVAVELAAPPPFTPATPADSPGCGSVAADGMQPVVSCQNYAYECTQIGGPCGPLNQCHCNWFPDFGWACGR